MESIRVTIKKGTVKIETSGFAGPACKAATDGLAKKLGKTVSDEPTAEMFDQPATLDTEIGR